MKKNVLTLQDAWDYIEELQDEVASLKDEIKELEYDIENVEEERDQLQKYNNEMEDGLISRIDTGLDTIRIYSDNGNLKTRQVVERISEGLCQPHCLPELFH